MTSFEHIKMPQQGIAPGLERATGWLNSKPLAPSDLKGQVAAYAFLTYTCINWLRMLPFVRAWDSKYRDAGLRVVGVHTPEFQFEHDLDKVSRALHAQNVDFVVAVDNNYDIWRSFDNHYWPALYLADGDGVIRYRHFGEGRYTQNERAIQQLLFENGAVHFDHELAEVTGVGVEKPADWDELRSAELYLGYGRTEHFASPGGLHRDIARSYSAPQHLPLNTWALSGDWSVRTDRVTASDGGGSVAVRFHARDLHMVTGSSDGHSAVRVQVRVDGQPPAGSHGLDVDEDGAGVITEPRMYQLVRQSPPITGRTAEITFLDPGAEAFVLTFG
ncbi:MAG TPA: hypothetical protein VKB75_08755 [Jatrophihabitans sp.]|nr:hypothetical protein [Jatrophihabitans sp.]